MLSCQFWGFFFFCIIAISRSLNLIFSLWLVCSSSSGNAWTDKNSLNHVYRCYVMGELIQPLQKNGLIKWKSAFISDSNNNCWHEDKNWNGVWAYLHGCDHLWFCPLMPQFWKHHKWCASPAHFRFMFTVWAFESELQPCQENMFLPVFIIA